MTSNIFKVKNSLALRGIILLCLGLFSSANLLAQDYPEIPNSISFGGINVVLDRSAQNIIEQDVKSLMSNTKFWEEKMERAISHFPIVEGILMEEEVPIDFKYLAVQESSFKPDVVSSSNAVGYWQFKAETAKELNLRVDDDVDERKSLSSSTHAAAWYLKKNNQQFNNWVSTLFSYYLGAGGVKKLIPSNWAYAREVTLTGKTDRYVLRFIAHKIALEAGIERYKPKSNVVLMESLYGKGQTIGEIAAALKVDANDLRAYNVWFRGDRMPSDREYYLTVPVIANQVADLKERLAVPSKLSDLTRAYDPSGFPILKISNIPAADKAGHQFYTINGLPGINALAGDKPKALAKTGKISLIRFMKNNDMIRNMELIPGNVYYLAKKNKVAATPFHTARPGDTWHSVSQEYGIRLVSLLKFNRTISRNYPIQTGQQLWLTKKRPKNEPVKIIPPKKQEPTIEVVDEPIAATRPNTAGAPIPANASERKKYTPVLVETSKSGSSSTSNKSAEVTVPSDETREVVPVDKPSTPSQTDDRVVIINGENEDEGMDNSKPAENPTLYSKSKPKAPEGVSSAPETVKRDRNTPGAVPKRYHTVSSGETYFSISKLYNLSVKELLEINNIETNSKLYVGQRLLTGIGESEELVVEKPKSAPERITNTSNSETSIHIVKAGETYFGISKQYGLSIDQLLEMNNLRANETLYVGQRLSVSSDSPQTVRAAVVADSFHVIEPGETLFRVSQKYNVSVDDLKQANGLTSNNVVVGQKLKIPVR